MLCMHVYTHLPGSAEKFSGQHTFQDTNSQMSEFWNLLLGELGIFQHPLYDWIYEWKNNEK